MMLRDTTELDRQAAIWVERMSRPVLDCELAADFDRWIGQDVRHLESYARLASLWQSDRLARALEAGVPRNDNDEKPGPADALAAQPAPPARSLRAGMAGHLAVALTAIVTLALTVFLAMEAMAPAQSYAAARGEEQVVRLADGSRVHLSGGTELAVRITPWSREVTLQRGEAFFEVAHERIRSFTVDTGSASVTVLGTAFNVNLRGDGEREIRVYRGLVTVEAGNGQWRVPAGAGVALDGAQMRSIDHVAGQRPGWIDGWFDAQEAALAHVVEQINRSSARQIVLADPALGALQVSGRFRLDRPVEVLETLGAIHGLTWEDDGVRLILSRS